MSTDRQAPRHGSQRRAVGGHPANSRPTGSSLLRGTGFRAALLSRSTTGRRPVYHRTRDSIEAHLTIVFAALAVSRWIEQRTGLSIRKLVKTARRRPTAEILAGDRVITGADRPPDGPS